MGDYDAADEEDEVDEKQKRWKQKTKGGMEEDDIAEDEGDDEE